MREGGWERERKGGGQDGGREGAEGLRGKEEQAERASAGEGRGRGKGAWEGGKTGERREGGGAGGRA